MNGNGPSLGGTGGALIAAVAGLLGSTFGVFLFLARIPALEENVGQLQKRLYLIEEGGTNVSRALRVNIDQFGQRATAMDQALAELRKSNDEQWKQITTNTEHLRDLDDGIRDLRSRVASQAQSPWPRNLSPGKMLGP